MKSYEAPRLGLLGTVSSLTASGEDKCGGSGDSAFPQILSERFAEECDPN